MKNCLNDAKEAFKDKMSESDIKGVYDTLNTVFDKAVSEKDYDLLRKKGMAFLSKRRQSMFKDKFILAQNIIDYEALKVRVDAIYENIETNGASFGSNAAKDTIVSLLFNDAKYGGASIESIRRSQLGRYTSFTAELYNSFGASIKDKIKQRTFRNKLLDSIKEGGMDDQLLKELWNTGNGKPISSKDPVIIKLTNIFHKVNSMMSLDKATANPLYKHRKNYGATLHYDADRTRAQGWDTYLKDVTENVNLDDLTEKMIDAGMMVDEKTVPDLLKTLFEKKTAIRSIFESKITDKAFKNVKDPQMFLRNLSDGRMFNYKDAEAYAYMFKKYNSGTVYDSTMMSIDATTRAIALDTVLGKLPMTNLQLMKERVLGKMNPNDIEARKNTENYFKNNLDFMYNVAAGTHTGMDNNWSKFTRNVKAITTSAFMGSAPIAAWLSDPAFASGIFGGLGDQNVFKKYFQINLETIKNLNPKRRNELGKKMDSYLSDVQFSILNMVTGQNLEKKQVGALTKMTDFVMSLSTFKLQNSVAKITNDRLHAHALGDELLSGSKVTPFTDRLRSYGIKDHDIELFKGLAKQDNGALYVQSIREADVDSTRLLLEESGIDPVLGTFQAGDTTVAKWTDERVKYYLNSLAAKYSAANYDLSRMASPTPNGFTNIAIVGQNAIPDNFSGMLVNLMTQFKSFSGSVLRTHRLMSNDKLVANRLKSVSGMVVLLMAAALAKRGLNDMFNLETPSDPTAFDEDAPILNNAFVRALKESSVLPFFADYALTDYAASGGSFTKSFAGPGFGMIQDTLDMAHAVVSSAGEDEVKWNTIIKPFMKYLPAQNLWYSKGLTNKYMLDYIKEVFDPQFKHKQDKLREENSGMLWEQKDLTEDLFE